MGSTTPHSGAMERWSPFITGLRAFVARRVPAQDVDDVCQEVMMRIHKGAHALREAGRAEAWIYGVARRAIADFYRARAARIENEETTGDGAEAAGPEEPRKGFGSFEGSHSVHEEVLSWLRPMAEGLPEGYREALLMADFEGRPQREVAGALGLSLSGAKSRIQRARGMLRRELQRCCDVQMGADGKVMDFRRRACDC